MQKGFINLSLTGYIILGLTVALLINLALLKIQTSRLDSEKAEFSAFRSEVNTAGIAAKQKADAENKLNQERKDKADREYKKLLAANTLLNQRLRDNASRSSLPDSASFAGSAETICFGRADLDAALRRFTEGAAGIAIEGQQATDSLNNAREWASQKPAND